MDAQLQDEVDSRTAIGNLPISMEVLLLRLKEIGYCLDRSMDCKNNPWWTTGPRAGKSYPAVSLYPVQIDNGLSAFNINARRDDNYRTLQQMRANEVYCVEDDRILEM